MRKINFNSRNSELGACILGIITELKKHNWESDAMMLQLISLFEALYAKFEEAVGKSIKNQYTRELSDSDSKLDNSFLALKYVLKALMYRTDELIREKAQKLMSIIESNDEYMNTRSYSSQLTLVSSTITEFDREENKTLITDLKISDFTSEFKNNFEEFKTMYEFSIEDNVELLNTPAATSIRPEIFTLINEKLIPYLSTMASFKPDVYDGTKQAIEVHIDKINRVVKARYTRAANVVDEAWFHDLFLI